MIGESTQFIHAIELDESSITRHTHTLENERQVALADIIEWNHFAIPGAQGPYALTLKVAENRITLTAASAHLKKPRVLAIALSPLRRLIRDYFLICESYFEAVRAGNLPRIEAIDMSRRGLHNEGAEQLTSMLAEKAEMDAETARRLFTLICVLHMK